MLIDWKIKDRVIGATTDNAKNIINAIEQINIQHLPCVDHTLQLVVKCGLEIAKVKSCISQCKSVVSHFKKSTKDTYSLRDKQAMLQLPHHEPIQDCVTQWGSTLAMLERLMEQQAAIVAVLMEVKLTHLMPSSDEWTLIADLVGILQPLQQATVR